jgi:hypothetical protein
MRLTVLLDVRPHAVVPRAVGCAARRFCRIVVGGVALRRNVRAHLRALNDTYGRTTANTSGHVFALCRSHEGGEVRSMVRDSALLAAGVGFEPTSDLDGHCRFSRRWRGVVRFGSCGEDFGARGEGGRLWDDCVLGVLGGGYARGPALPVGLGEI